jgi:feruloyl esterase
LNNTAYASFGSWGAGLAVDWNITGTLLEDARRIAKAMPHRSIFYPAILCLALVHAAAQQPCENLTALSLPGVKITLATAVPAGEFALPSARANAPAVTVPAFCRVAGVINAEVHFEIWMPADWNRKFLAVGNGGLAGNISYAAMLAPLGRGYATGSTDTGHVASDEAWALGHMQRVIDFAHRAVHVMTQADKAIIQAFYGAAPAHSYFQGCSQGGQEALTEAQRYPRDFDGIIAGDPANYWTHLYLGAHLWITQATQQDPASYLPASKIPALAAAVNDACDALDGIKDGIINDPRRCHFEPSTLLCKNGDAADCLTAPQVEAVRKIYQGAHSSDGQPIFPGILPGAEDGPGGWANWITGSEPGKAAHTALGMPFLRYVAFEDPAWDFRTFSFDKKPGFDSDVEFVDNKLGPIFNNINPDLRAFRANGGRLIQYHGFNDPDISPLNSINYYQSVAEFMNRDATAVGNFYRLFLVPGMQHCAGGPGPTHFDMIDALDQWVDHGKAPEQIVASHTTNGKVDRTRPLCPYPLQAQWKGSGSTDEAQNFSCVAAPAQ